MIITNQLYGIKNPKVHIKVKNDYKIDDIKIYLNDKLYTEYNANEVNINNNILDINMVLPISTSKVKIVMYSDDREIILLNKRYDYFIRIIKVISKPFRVLCDFIKKIFRPIIKTFKIMWVRHHFIIPPKKLKRYIKSFIENYKHPQNNIFYNPEIPKEYNRWVNENNSNIQYKKYKYNPLISVIIPVYNVSESVLDECINSVLNQTYDNFEICIADDNSTLEETKTTLNKYENNSKIKIKYRKNNGMISKCMNSAIGLATGEFVCFLDNDDMLDKDALYYVVKELNDNRKLDLIYTDEDKLDERGLYCDPHFKPDYSPDTLLSLNYICHLTVIRKQLGDKIGWFRSEYDGAQDYDLLLRVTENTTNISHISRILYHWRKSATSTSANNNNKDYARLAGKRALEDALKRRKINGEVLLDKRSPFYIIAYKLKEEPKVSIVIPTKDHKELLSKCISSIYKYTVYKNYEIIIVDNNSKEHDALEYLKEIEEKYENIKVIHDKNEFNFSKINNDAIKNLDTDYILLLNNDTEVITERWLSIMVGYASQAHVGCVGAKLLYSDETIQHAGVILGLGGVASHAYIGTERNAIGYFGRLCVPYNYSANTAACLMVSKDKFDEVGGLNEKLKVAYNDIDFNIKLLKKGYYNVFLPQVELFHYESKSRGLDTKGEKKERFLKETKYMNDMWADILYSDKYYNKNFSLNGWFMLDRRK